MKYVVVAIVLILFNIDLAQAAPCKEVVGYYPSWQWYDRNKLVRPATIDYSKYTIINYAFFYPLPNGTIVGTDSWADENLLLGEINWQTNPPSYYPNTSLIDLAHNNNVKVLLSIGGWTLSNNFPAIAADSNLRKNFAHSCKMLCEMYNFDGIDIDWEYPGYAPHNGTPADKINYTLLLQAVRDSIDAFGSENNRQMLLTACAGAAAERMADIEWDNVMNILDFVNLMSYDYHGTWDNIANHNAPLFSTTQGNSSFNLDSSVSRLINYYNVNPQQINAGVAFYGRSMKTISQPALFGNITGQADIATFPEDEGTPQYYNVLKKMNQFSQHWDSIACVPYLLGNSNLFTFVSYDDKQSIAQKAKYIIDNNLRGAIIWEITGDYIETYDNSGIIASTPLADTLNFMFCNYTSLLTHNIELQQGWNMISSYLIPQNTLFSDITNQIIGQFTQVKNAAGQVYMPPFLYTLSNWNSNNAYQIFATTNTTLNIIGEQIIPENSPISINQSGWYWLPYYRTSAMTPAIALSSIQGNYSQVKHINGQVFMPPFLNTLQILTPGNGYFIYITQPTILTFPANE